MVSLALPVPKIFLLLLCSFLAVGCACPPPLASSTDGSFLHLPHHIPESAAINAGSLHAFNITRPEGVRQFYVYAFAQYQVGTLAPLALYFHGFGGSYEQGIQFNMTDAADRQGYLLVFPQGTPSTERGAIGWNGGRCCLFPNGTNPVDDVGFTRQMVKMASAAFTVDPQRVYAMGWSNGGYMSERLGCEAADILAGVAADASAVIIGDTNMTGLALCDHYFGNHSLNYIHYSGLIDSTVAWTGGGSNHELLPSALLDFARWTRRGGCGPELEQTLNQIQTPDNLALTTFSNLVWNNCRGSTEMEWVTARNGMHAWWTLEQDGFSTTDHSLQFFTRTYHKKVFRLRMSERLERA